MKPSKRVISLLHVFSSASSTLHTVGWRDYVPLSNRGLVDIDDTEWSLFGHRPVSLTEKGRRVWEEHVRQSLQSAHAPNTR